VATGAVSANTILIRYTNDTANRDLEIDYITVGGTTYQTEASSTYGMGVWTNVTDGCGVGGYYSARLLNCTGYFHFLANNATLRAVVSPKMASVKMAQLQLAPNPVSNYVSIKLTAVENQKMTVRLYNIVGQQVYQSQQSIAKGNNVLSIPVSLPKGIYFLHAAYDKKDETVKFIVAE